MKTPAHNGTLFVFTLVLLVAHIPYTVLALASLTNIMTVHLEPDSDESRPESKVAAGMDIAFVHGYFRLLDGTPIKQDRVSSASDTLVSTIANTINDGTICVIGPGNDAYLNTLLLDEDLHSKRIVFFTPFTQTSTVRQWNEQLYFTTPPPTAELLALFSYVVSNHRPAKVGFMYLAESGLGEESLALLNRQLTAQGLSYAQVFVQPVSQVNPDPSAMQQFFNSRPQVVFIFGTTGLATRSFFQQAVQSQALIDSESVLACPFALMDDLLRTYDALVKGNVEPLIAPSRILFSSPVPLVTDTHFPKSVAAFTAALELSLIQGLITTADKTLAFSGWVSAQVAFQAALRYAYGTRAQFAENIFQQNRYIIMDELIVGDYGGPCSSNTADIGAACSCNQGGHSVYVSSVAVTNRDADIIPISSGNFHYPLGKCTPDDAILFNPIYTLGVEITTIPKLKYVHFQKLNVTMALANKMYSKHKIAVTVASETASGIQGKLDTIFAKAPPDVVIGPLPTTVTNTYQALVLDPVYEYTPLINTNDHTIYTCPTLDQELFVLAKYIKTRFSSLSAVVVSSSSNAIDTPIERAIGEACKHFNVNVDELKVVPGRDFSALLLAMEGVTVVINLPVTAVNIVIHHLEENPKAVVALSFTDITTLYRLFANEIKAFHAWSRSADRLIFATNLPPWMSDANTVINSSTAGWSFTNGFLTAVPESAFHTPAGMRGYLVSKFLEELSMDLDVVTSQSLLSNLYRRRYITVDGVTLGPYSGACSERVQDDCGQNFGARDISVWAFSRCLDASKPALTEPETPWVPNRAQGKDLQVEKATTPSWVVVLSVCLSVLVLALALAGLYFYLYRGDSRDNRNAPKDSTKPVTVIFTDIESSTAIWSHAPQEMTRALTAHHKTIRDLIVKYKCYEVKTIGDAFMIVTHDAYAAVQLAREVQIAFMDYNWGTDKIDEVYCRKHNTAQRPSDADYASCWSGLRIRVGIHTGMSDIRFDDVTKGYDYYGDTSNTAARTEALGCGGQIIATQYAWDALTEEQQDSFKVHPLGAQYLRGVATAIHMYEVIAVEQRCFPDLRTVPVKVRADHILPACNTNNDMAALQQALCESPSRQNVHGTEERERVVDEKKKRDANNILDAYLGPYSAKEKRKMLEVACKQFGIQIPDKRSFATSEEHVEAMMKCVASRTAIIADYREQMQHIECVVDHLRSQASSRRQSRAKSNSLSEDGSKDSSSSDISVYAAEEFLRPRDGADYCALWDDTHVSSSVNTRNLMGCIAPPFLNGVPTVVGDTYVKCFEEGNGLLFRISNRATNQVWYYNDTRALMMYVDFSFGRYSSVKFDSSPGIVMTVSKRTGRYEGRLDVPPMCTVMLVEGLVKGYDLQHSARKIK